MITSKLHKDAKPQNALIELSTCNELPEAVVMFMDALRGENMLMRRQKIPPHQINFYLITERKDFKYQEVQLKSTPSQFTHMITVLYMNHKTQNLATLPELPSIRTLLLREDLEPYYSLDYEIQTTTSKKQSVVYLCSLCSALINSCCAQQLNFFDQRIESLSKQKGDSSWSMLQLAWIDILLQIPGIGSEKAYKISQSYPTYQSIVRDCEGPRKLKDLEIGTRKIKLGSQLANRIYKVMTSTNHTQLVK